MRGRGIHSSQSGFTLIEILIASGLVMVVTLGLSQLMFKGTQGARGITMTSEFESLMSNVQQLITNEGNCRQFLQSRVPGSNLGPGTAFPLDLGEVSIPGGLVILRKTPVGQEGGLTIKKIELTGVQSNLPVLPSGNQARIFTMTIEAERLTGPNNQKTVGSEKLTKSFPITVVNVATPDPNPADAFPAGQILNCYQDPGVVDVCMALGGRLNANGVTCDIGPEVCRQLGGTYTAGNNPPCDYAPGGVPGAPLTNITERVCLDLGGTYTGGNPACTFGQNQDTGATSVTGACASLGGLVIPGPGGPGTPGKCNFCAAHGGEWNAGMGGGVGGCDFARKPCEGRSRPGFPAVYDPATQTCDSNAADCNRLGGVISGAPPRCHVPLQRASCLNPVAGIHSFDVGIAYPGEGEYTTATPAGGASCPQGYYVADLSGFATRSENNALDGFLIQVLCCKVTP